MKKYKKLLFTFSMSSLFGFVWGFMDVMNFQREWEFLFLLWLMFSLPLIILFIWTRIFD